MKRFLLILLLLPFAFAQVPDTARINVDLLSQDPDPVGPGSIVDVRFQVNNIGTESIKGAMIEMTPEFPFSKAGEMQKILGTINARQIGEESYVVFFKLHVSEQATSGIYDLDMRISFDEGKTYKYLNPYNIRVKTEDPILAIDSVITEPEQVSPGNDVNVSIGLKNMAETFFRRISIKMGLEELPFSPIGSSNEKTIEILGGNAQKSVDFIMTADAEADSGIYKIPTTITFTDDSGEIRTTQQIISLQVGKEPELMVQLDNNEPFIIGSTNELEIRFVNKDTEDVRFLTATLRESDEYEIISSSTEYVGNIDSDDYETAEYDIRCIKCEDKEATFTVDVEYADENNNQYSDTYTVKNRVFTQQEAVEQGLVPKNNTLGVLIVIAIVVVGFVIYRYRKKRKK
ncbi:MAG: COG1361 S-layer family protein [Candidatus Woesearchaeota archaeon]